MLLVEQLRRVVRRRVIDLIQLVASSTYTSLIDEALLHAPVQRLSVVLVGAVGQSVAVVIGAAQVRIKTEDGRRGRVQFKVDAVLGLSLGLRGRTHERPFTVNGLEWIVEHRFAHGVLIVDRI